MANFDQTLQEIKAATADKVRKLLAQAEDPAATPEEAATFTAKAQQLMTKYSIDLAMVADPQRADQVVAKGWRIDGPYANHKVSLVNAAARSNDCRAVYTNLAGGAKHIDVVGYPNDVDWVRTLSHSLAVQMMAALAAAARAVRAQRVHGRTFAAGFAMGFVDEIAGRMLKARRAAVAEAEASLRAAGAEQAAGRVPGASAEPGASALCLVLVAKGRRVDDEYRARFPHARSVSRDARLRSWSGYEPGRSAGRRANLARASVAGRRSLAQGT